MTRFPHKPASRLLALILMFGACGGGAAAESAAKTKTVRLKNGARLSAVHFPGSTSTAIFTFCPLGLADDGPGQAQWSHLVEHLVIRSTQPEQMAANAETLPDHMRLDFYGTTANWEEGLDHHVRWLRGVPFTEKILEAEKPRVNAECDFTARSLATHKFAIAAWAQGFRHGARHAAIKGNVLEATPAQIQQYRDKYLVAPQVLICVVGGLEPDKMIATASRQLETIPLPGQPSPAVALHPGDHSMTWDLDASHLLLTWPIPKKDTEDFAALLVAAQWLNMQLSADARVKEITGMVLAGADVSTPEGNFFYISAALKPNGSHAEVRNLIESKVEELSGRNDAVPMLGMIGGQLAGMLTDIPDPEMLSRQAPAKVTRANLEMNIGLQWAMQEYRYGEDNSGVARQLSRVTETAVRRAAKKYLKLKDATGISLRPASASDR
jgi:predicted Zn-dependent peptidase